MKTTLPNFVYIATGVASYSNYASFFALGIISAALLYIPLSFPLTWITTAAIVTGCLIGGMIGALGGGPIADRLGRRKTMILGSGILLLGNLGFTAAPTLWFIITSRFVAGFGVGIITSLANLLVVELAPAQQRGSLSTIPYVFQFLGTMTPFLISYLIVLALPKDSLSLAWRLMGASAVIVSTLDLIALIIWLPESPRWLIYHNYTLEGLAVMEKIYGPENHELLIQDYRSIVEATQSTEPQISWTEMIKKGKYRRPVTVGIILQLIRRLSGNAVVTFYLTLILIEAAGLKRKTALLVSVLIYIPDFLVVFGVFRLLDRLGRKLMMFISCFGLALAILPLALVLTVNGNASSAAEHKLFIFGYFQGAQLDNNNVPTSTTVIVISSLILQRCLYSFGLGPIPSIHTAESLPHGIRAKGLGLALFFSWIAAALSSTAFPWALVALPAGSIYWMFFAVAVLGVPFIFFGVRETVQEHIDSGNTVTQPQQPEQSSTIVQPKPTKMTVNASVLEEVPIE